MTRSIEQAVKDKGIKDVCHRCGGRKFRRYGNPINCLLVSFICTNCGYVYLHDELTLKKQKHED